MKRTFIFLLALASPALAHESRPPDPLFRESAALPVTLTAPISTLIREKPDEEPVLGSLSYTSEDGEPVTFDLKIKARGHSRLDICQIPPLWLNFKKSQVKGSLFHKQDKLKLAVHCGDSRRFEQTILREYVAYRMLNELTPMSFNVRLLHVTWVDSDAKRKEQLRYAFLLEHKNRLGKRIDRKDLKIEATSVAEILPDHLNLTSIFQFMIANTDFSPIAPSPYNECCHNYVLFRKGEDPIVAIPYDFDQSGLVNAPYAAPGEQFSLQSVRQRLYRGRCENDEHVEANLQRFRDARPRIEKLISTQEGLYDADRRSLMKYISDFYKIVDNPKHRQRRIHEKCIPPAS